ncbi:isochorismate synthase [Balneolaceae bacterium ANBcel3]|nr:isochorismate synthase [Balneolaceae bacterium ANBcel3]
MTDQIHKVAEKAGAFMSALLEKERFSAFYQKHRPTDKPRYLTLSVPYDNIDPLAVLELNADPKGTRFYWERPDHDIALAAGGRAALIKSTGLDRFRTISRQADSLSSSLISLSDVDHSMSGAHFVGGFSFFDQPMSGAWSTLGNASFVLPEWLLARDGRFSIMNITRKWSKEDRMDELGDWYREWMQSFNERLQIRINDSYILSDEDFPSESFRIEEREEDRKRWLTNVEIAKNAIQYQQFKKIVLARELRFQVPSRISSTKFIHCLRKDYPSCYSFIYQLNGEAIFLGTTPEKLLSRQGPYLKTEALAGSTSRGVTATSDTIFAKKLLESKKNQEEHAYVLESIKEKLRPITETLDHPAVPFIKKYSNVQHLCTPVSASLSGTVNSIHLVSRLHPTPAVGGYPESIAIDHIQEMEQLERGWYAGPVGWFNTRDKAEFSVAIRSALIQNKHVRIFAGCGIVEESDPQTEWEETRIKLLPMQKGLGYALHRSS